ncbi:CDP-diacylglycerol--serine O-phosphatidyltransferase [Rhodopirellula sp. JC740]|uniref:CDP-diacylglycerol--serine O-phosphatidyltransferase n=1 Tax=Rhodopirellula halodulae TaxID=2894198 RepID=A0ABS8NQH7_9BACT|nr:CDP-diacylglycerol--serine O-phosphatidyltransferase [Rhodopirellula sp. JC740]MCC9644711.1 CDP-diacylglycerol--serine O-phosphatidyltransferase [Rhodopirellula sp. JC740]
MSELKPRHPLVDDEMLEDDLEMDLESDQQRSRLGRRRKRKRGHRRRLTLAVLPTILTLGNGVCGLAAIAIAVSTASLDWTPESKLFAAGLLIFGGMLFDALDGSAARLTGQASRFGAELDSLCDAVTFGVAPAVIVWRISDVLLQRLTWGIGVLFALCVLIRLARFNVETPEDDDHEGFEGLPSPAAAGTIAAFAIAIPDLADFAVEETYPEWIHQLAQFALNASHYVIPTLALVLAFLMVSRYEYPHVFAQLVRGRRAPHQIGQALFAVVGVVLLHWVALPVVFCYFAFMSPVRSFLQGKSASTAGSNPTTSAEGG